ncbi:phosphopantetheine-binding protein, partial [Bacillus glycinifermentans]
EDGESRPYICAYITAKCEIAIGELREWLRSKLPEYMIPAYFVKLDKLPLTKNGKVDRKALPEPDKTAASETEYEAPRNFVEEQILSILQDVLGTERMGISCRFFERGGNSLKAMHAVNSINKAFGINMSVGAFFENPTAKNLAYYVLQADAVVEGYAIEFSEEEI